MAGNGSPSAVKRGGRQGLVTLLVIGALMVGMLAWGYFALRAIGDRTRHWEYDTPPLTPAESYYSTEPAPPHTEAPKQIELPPPTINKKKTAK